MSVTFKDFRVQVKEAINQNCEAFLHEATGEIASQAADNSKFVTGQYKGGWGTAVNGNEGIVGNTEEHSIWNEFGTGKYAMKGDGREGGWAYQDDNGNWHFTKGMRPKRTLQNAFATKKAAIITRAKQIFGGM